MTVCVFVHIIKSHNTVIQGERTHNDLSTQFCVKRVTTKGTVLRAKDPGHAVLCAHELTVLNLHQAVWTTGQWQLDEALASQIQQRRAY